MPNEDVFATGVQQSGHLLTLAPGVALHERLTYRSAYEDALDFGGKALLVTADVRYSRFAQRYRVEGLEVRAELTASRSWLSERRLDHQAEVTATDLRLIQVQPLVRHAVQLALTLDQIDPHQSLDLTPSVRAFLYPEQDQPPPEVTASAVASVYQLAEAIGERPAKAVATTFRLQQRTATNWIRRARQQRLLGDGDEHGIG